MTISISIFLYIGFSSSLVINYLLFGDVMVIQRDSVYYLKQQGDIHKY